MCPILHVAVMLSQTGCHESLPHHSLKIVALCPILYKDIEVVVVTATGDRGWNCQNKRFCLGAYSYRGGGGLFKLLIQTNIFDNSFQVSCVREKYKLIQDQQTKGQVKGVDSHSLSSLRMRQPLDLQSKILIGNIKSLPVARLQDQQKALGG